MNKKKDFFAGKMKKENERPTRDRGGDGQESEGHHRNVLEALVNLLNQMGSHVETSTSEVQSQPFSSKVVVFLSRLFKTTSSCFTVGLSFFPDVQNLQSMCHYKLVAW